MSSIAIVKRQVFAFFNDKFLSAAGSLNREGLDVVIDGRNQLFAVLFVA